MDAPAPGPAPAVGAARVVMPFSCAVDQGTVVLQPAQELSYEITGTREQRLFTTCDPPFSNNCRSLTVHKFKMACGAERISWHRVVAAIGQTAAGEASVAKDHLVLVRDADRGTGHVPSCTDRKGGAAGSGECLPWSVRKPKERLVLPQGFAPLGEAGARFLDDTLPTIAPVAPGSVQTAAQLPGSGPYRITPDLSGEDAFADISRASATAQTISQEVDSSEGWTTSLSFNTIEENAPEVIVATSSVSGQVTANAASAGSDQPALAWVALLAGVLALAAAIVVYRMPQLHLATDVSGAAAVARRSARRAQDHAADLIGTVRNRLLDRSHGAMPSAAEQSGDPALTSALLQLRAMLARTEAAVATLSSASVVREVMQTEVATLRERIDEADRAARRGSTPVMKLAAQFRQIARDIDRVQSITESAAHGTNRSN
jgi:hypothetical protein